tara:strand:+ start:213 stop:596 length:384 start_codon:yes stop_codon:yes gene_type:complete
MNENHPRLQAIHIYGVNLWAHVGVLDQERLMGQEFIADISFWLDLDDAAIHDDLSSSIDYSFAIKKVQKLSFQMDCLTIERFSENILDVLEEFCGAIPMRILLKKCYPPIQGFNGSVAVERRRNFKF